MIRRMSKGAASRVLEALCVTGIVWGGSALASLAEAAPSGDCVTATIDVPFRLPDGVLHPAGDLTLCDTRAFSPVAEMHLIRVDGRSAGLFLSRKQSAEAEVGRTAEVVFERGGDGQLDLVGYILPAEGGFTAFRLKGRDTAWVEHVPPGPAVASGSTVALALSASTR